MERKINIYEVLNNLLLSFLSFLGVIYVFILSNQLTIKSEYFIITNGWYYILLFLIILLVNMIWIRLISKIWENDNTTIKDDEINPLEAELLPVYLWLFIIALSLKWWITIENISLMLFVFLFWLFMWKNIYFNPFFLILWYRFYKFKSKSNTNMILIIRRSDLKKAKKFDKLIRVNNFTFLKK